MPVFIGPPIEITIESALNTLKLFLVGQSSQKEAREALNYLNEFIQYIREECKE